MRIVHCSDVHITEDYFSLPLAKLGWRRWIALGEITLGGRGAAYLHAKRKLAAIAAESLKHDHLILSGDLTAYALEGEFQGAKNALAPVVNDRQRMTVIPGNHDVFTPGSHRTHRFEKHFGHLLESDLPEFRAEGAFPFVRLLGDRVAVVGLKSARVPAVPGLSYGVIGKAQLEAVNAIAREPRLKDRTLLVVVHHAPFTQHGTPDKPYHGLRDAKQLLKLLPGPRYAVLHGHIHHRFHHEATATTPHILGAGSSTQEGREGYWLIDVEAPGTLTARKQPLPGQAHEGAWAAR